MEQYIPKSAVVAEIDRRISILQKHPMENHKTICHLDSLKQSINSLEVKEVDIEKELIEWHKEHFQKSGTFIGMSGFYITNSSQMELAKHFFELGLKASNPLTWEDISVIRQTMADYRIEENHERNNEDFCKEVLKRFKAQKGE